MLCVIGGRNTPVSTCLGELRTSDRARLCRNTKAYDMQDIEKQIKQLKEEKNAIILAHYYQTGDILDIADMVGDSYGLSKKARDNDADIIVFCGVRFMAESAKILSPEKKVLLPAEHAGCPMADMVTPEDIIHLRETYPDAAIVCYVNSTSAVKAECDVCVTSSNAVKVVASLSEEQIVFVPDQNLARYVATQLPGQADHSVQRLLYCAPSGRRRRCR